MGDSTRALTPFLPALGVAWTVEQPNERWREVEATLVFADVSGFTQLSERLARRGRIGAEELTDVLGARFADLLAVAYRRGGSLLKFGGDALLLLFTEDGHEARGADAAVHMVRTMRALGPVRTSAGAVRLRISIGVHSGPVHLFRVGSSHRELVITGPAATTVVEQEAVASPGEVVVSAGAAARLPASMRRGDRLVIHRRPDRGGVIAPPPDPGTDVASAVPVALRDHLRSGRPDAEHRFASIAFVHFDGVDDLLRRHGPDAVADALEQLVVTVQDAADVEQVTFLATDVDRDGGKIILVAGAPVAHEDDGGRLLRCVRSIASAGTELPVRIGVNRGHIFAGEIGPSYRLTYTVMGDAVNLAARMMSAAAPGQVLSTASVIDASRTAFDLTEMPPFRVKGKREPVAAFAVGAAVGVQRVGDDVGLAGRDEEIAAVTGSIDALRKGRGGRIEIVGGRGMGKSRLVRQACELATGVDVVAVTCEAYESSTPYAAVLRALRSVLGDVAVPDNDLAGEARRRRTTEAVVQLLESGLARPTLLVFEGAHWMDDASAEVVERLAEMTAERPWLLVITRRESTSGFRPDLDHRWRTLALDPLPRAEAVALVRSLTADAPLRHHEVDAIVDRAGGNPLLLAALARAPRAGGDLPATVHAVVAADIDRLDPYARDVLRVAAVLGGSCTTSALREVACADVPIGSLDRFLDIHRDGTVRFRDEAVRETAYESLTFRRRAELHRRAADAVIGAAGERLHDHAAVVALHAFHGGQYDRAFTMAVAAADRAVTRYANVEAAALYERALAAARHLGTVADDELARLSTALGDAHALNGEYDAAGAAYRNARRLTPEHRQGRLHLKEAELAERRGSVAGAVRWVRRGLRLLDGCGDDPDPEIGSQRAQLEVWYAALRQKQGRHDEAVRWCERAIASAQRAGDRDALAHSYFILDWALVDLGRAAEAVHSPKALAIYEELGNESGRAVVLNNLGGFAYYEGRWDDALKLYERSREARLRTGNVVDAALSTCNIGEILTDQGRLDEAGAAFGEALEVYRAAGYRSGIAFARMHLGRLAARSGRTPEALELLNAARAEFAGCDADAGVLETDVWLVECSLLRGDAHEALLRAEHALRRAEAMGGLGVLEAVLHRSAGYACAMLDDRPTAVAHLESSLDIARERGARHEVALTLAACAALDASTAVLAPRRDEDHTLILEGLGVRVVPALGTTVAD